MRLCSSALVLLVEAAFECPCHSVRTGQPPHQGCTIYRAGCKPAAVISELTTADPSTLFYYDIEYPSRSFCIYCQLGACWILVNLCCLFSSSFVLVQSPYSDPSFYLLTLQPLHSQCQADYRRSHPHADQPGTHFGWSWFSSALLSSWESWIHSSQASPMPGRLTVRSLQCPMELLWDHQLQ